MEEWKDIEGFEGKYQVSIKGNVRSLNYNNTGNPKILKAKINKQGHLEVTLSKNNKHNYRMVSRLVFETFAEKKLGKNDVLMYKDKDKTNCALENLYLITRGNRQEITYDLDHRKIDNLGRRYLVKYEFYDEELNTKEISQVTGIDSETIQNRLRDLNWNIYEAAEIPVAKMKRGKDND